MRPTAYLGFPRSGSAEALRSAPETTTPSWSPRLSSSVAPAFRLPVCTFAERGTVGCTARSRSSKGGYMSLVDGFIEMRENAEGRHSRLLHWLFRIVGLATLGGAMWIILWIDNR